MLTKQQMNRSNPGTARCLQVFCSGFEPVPFLRASGFECACTFGASTQVLKLEAIILFRLVQEISALELVQLLNESLSAFVAFEGLEKHIAKHVATPPCL